MRWVLIIVIFVIVACTSEHSIDAGMSMVEVESLIGKADSIQSKVGIPDIYTNKIIKMETWHYGSDTLINFADDKVQNIVIKRN